MNYSEKLVYFYRKNFKPNVIKNTYVTFKVRNDIAVWSNDPVYVANMIFAKVNGEQLDLGRKEKEIKDNASKYGLVVYETDLKHHSFTACIPKGTLVDVAMNVEDQQTLSEEYIADTAVINFNGLKYYTQTMDNDYLRDYFMHREEIDL